MKLRDVFVRNRRSSALLERFLVASVTTILVIRFFLATTGYPQLGGRGLHIAHMLWGGLLMLIALILSLAFLGRRVQTLAALLGGIGFGAFIDELGKFITSDNNYFFQPTIALIYVIFIVLLLSFRILERSPYVSEQERLANALNILEEAALHNLSERDKEEILWLLRAYDVPASPLHMLADAVERMPVVSASRPGLLKRITRATRRFYLRLAHSPHFSIIVTTFFIGYVLVLTVLLVVGVVNLTVNSVTKLVVEIGLLGSSLLSYIMIVIGLLFLRRSPLGAYAWFKRAVLVSIFLTQIFIFYTQQLGALDELAVNLIALVTLDYLMHNRRRDKGVGYEDRVV